jgi:histone-lysine N-methyltransferase SUV420H
LSIQVYFWSSIRKLKSNYHACRGVLEADVCKALQTHAIVEKDAAAAQEKLLKLSGLSKYHKGLRTEDEKEHFVRHLRKYVNIYLPDCPFEVGTTNRYTIQTAEACIIARKPIKKGEVVKYLSGIQVEMTEKEEEELSSRTDFSIVLSSRRKRPSLFLGPARFANHDCDSNAKLNTTGPHGIHIVACKDIAVGDEITVVYGMDYFGEDNCECLCGTCERLLRNGWDPRGPILHEDGDEDSEKASVKREEQPSRGCSEASNASKRKREDVGRGFIVEETSARHDRGRLPKRPKVHNVKPAEEELDDPPRIELQREAPIEEEMQQDPLLRKIVNLLRRSADRPEPIRSVTIKTREPEETTSENQSNDHLASPSELSPPSDEYIYEHADARSASPSKELPQRTCDAITTSSLETTKPNKLPSVKKLRSYSSLRTVTNATDSQADPYSLPDMMPIRSALPDESKPMKRGPGRPRKIQQPTQPDSSSSSTESIDSSSNQSSGSSSVTSNEFVPGAIAHRICESLISKGGEEDLQDNESAIDNNRTISRSTTRSQTREDTPLRSPEKSSGRRRSTRGNPLSSLQKPELPTKAVRSIEQSQTDTGLDDSDSHIKRGIPRTPKDYTLCRTLLLTVHHRWVECRNCDEYFLQADAYQTRIACPRCERHSKLYGYHWPKTDREGKNDNEPRILDHRLIHRFIDAEEEKSERKGRKALADLLVKEREGSERQQSEEENSLAIAAIGKAGEKVMRRNFRSSPRRSEARRRGLRMTM